MSVTQAQSDDVRQKLAAARNALLAVLTQQPDDDQVETAYQMVRNAIQVWKQAQVVG